ncbi:hypothetical protein MKX07_000339 [Trichoderma sp. CBMAI-0711]|uniref:BTB domain-containing protein n=1 Tax=Trichoderma parareesei TaxID=858221 RepID=A0A2H2ZNA1_TRIPA|nr:hypothetical protein MKX07_000339 [Trichoderma sp. CBMAI-0711]OTA07158.1 hypothetical protein A9Z42_0080270 [Trichoderma parareesei]
MPSDEVEKVPEDASTQDVEMDQGEQSTQAETENPTGSGDRAPPATIEAADDVDAEADPVEERKTFASSLMSPVVTLMVGKEEPTLLQAHQAFLVRSPYFEDICSKFAEDGSPRHIELPDEDFDAVGCFLEFLYTGEYFPRKIAGQRTLEHDPSIPPIDDSGIQLLKHAKIYTLAQKWGVAALQTLAANKIHCINSTVKGEIEYARYVYANTAPDDTTIRAPVANFWATRSHTLRSEAEDEFKALCLEFPQFGFDILTRVLDDKLKRERNEKMHPSSGSVRKRPRHSSATGA